MRGLGEFVRYTWPALVLLAVTAAFIIWAFHSDDGECRGYAQTLQHVQGQIQPADLRSLQAFYDDECT